MTENRLPKKEITAVHDLGLLLKRMIQVNTGEYPCLPATPLTADPADWATYKVAAEIAIQHNKKHEAETAWLKAQSIANQFPANDARVPYTLESLANFYMNAGKFEQAEQYWKESLQSIEVVYGANDVRIAECLNSLAGLYYQQKRFVEAVPLGIRMLTIYNKIYGPDHAEVGMAANNLAMLYHAQLKYDLAELMYERALPIRKRALGKGNPQFKTLIENYSNLLITTGRADKADALRAENGPDGDWRTFECRVPVAS
jgi:tetratricopeptide (TPR) repeat protein